MRKALLALALLAASGGGCGGGSSDLTVFAAASLSDALPPEDGIRYSFAGSQQLVAQIEGGADPDVLVTADERTIKQVADDYRPVATATLAIAVAPGNPKQIRTLQDLSRATVVLADPSVPIGRYAQEILTRAGVTVRPKSLELDVEAALQKVAIGEADAAIAYSVAKAELVAIPAEQNTTARYYAAALTDRGRRYVQGLAAHLQSRGFGAP